ncbi:hypothetical protein C5167_013832 [Papaver somniferum]|uniref:Uncharacterized protein n=1 Tax=Papaver somniferum TaxID=3469 RepID=A0A4Y7J4K3_PAPSO|nr:protein CHAPERONE-LIKE PROTEIN OF POR1, chloroplastic-like [Papaver somniferum]RZC54980.1 hypothetical protein C5167_013832 [Papaver somniferum]
MANTLSMAGVNHSIIYKSTPISSSSSSSSSQASPNKFQFNKNQWMGSSNFSFLRRTSTTTTTLVHAGFSKADDSAPSGMSLEDALKLLGVSEGASFDEILRAKNSILSTCKDDQDAIAQVEAAYDMLLMQSLTQRRAGKVLSNSIRYADAKPVKTVSRNSSMPQWLQSRVMNSPVSVETPTMNELGVQAGVYGTLMALQYFNGISTSNTPGSTAADVPGLILAGSFGASLYFLTKKNSKLGKATLITIGGLVVGAVAGSAIENFLQVDIIPFIGIRSPAVIVSEIIVFSQFLVSLYLS